MAALCMCVCEQEGGQAGTPGATQHKEGLSAAAVTHREWIKIYMYAVAVQYTGKCNSRGVKGHM